MKGSEYGPRGTCTIKHGISTKAYFFKACCYTQQEYFYNWHFENTCNDFTYYKNKYNITYMYLFTVIRKVSYE
jgi:hypothetical protein